MKSKQSSLQLLLPFCSGGDACDSGKKPLPFCSCPDLNPMKKHPLKRLGEAMDEARDWDFFEREFADRYSLQGAPAKPIRLMVGLILIAWVEGLKEEEVIKRWENKPHYQYFCDPLWCFKDHSNPPCSFKTLKDFKKRIRREGMKVIEDFWKKWKDDYDKWKRKWKASRVCCCACFASFEKRNWKCGRCTLISLPLKSRSGWQ